MIYFDNSATTKPFHDVLQAFVKINEQYYANPASIHEAGVEANALLSRAREQVATILRTEPAHTIFTSGGTESNNLAIFGLAKSNEHIGKHIITTAIEHPSVLEAMKVLEEQGYSITYLPVNASGEVTTTSIQQALRKDTVLVSIMHVNNEIGAVQPLAEIAKIVHEQSRAHFHVDAVQSFGKLPIYFNGEAGPDCITISGHKIHGLKGTGLLAFRKRPLITPHIVGGGQEFGIRSGTVAVAQNVVLAKAMRLAFDEQEIHFAKYVKWRHQLVAMLLELPDVKVVSTKQGAPHIITFAVKELRGEILINALQGKGLIVSTSSACSSKQQQTSHVLEAIKLDPRYKKGVVRMSLGALTTDQEVTEAARILRTVITQLKGASL
ncbi:aminotransferase class V [Lysinibacillus sp. BF-4]|uniref:cysteine desulfurase family protein n=1 Tax=Lysinibacillus sp. BF-4 TaxID=1473546 RepID=UPI0005041107|nr:cysteine desulfurase family protein [Lysinibacillus sp. BF-4]KFL44170.1 aminotransferase class V [Lysinibacillus sp. BF-4]